MSSEVYALYDQSLEFLTRLSGYVRWSSKCLGGFVEEDVDHMAIALIRRDLLMFAATTRNLTEYTRSVSNMKEIRFKTSIINPSLGEKMVEDGIYLNIYQALSRILHSEDTTIMLGISPLMHSRSRDAYENYLLLTKFRDKFYDEGTLVGVRSEKEESTYFYLERLLKSVAMFLHVIVEAQRVRGTIMDLAIRHT